MWGGEQKKYEGQGGESGEFEHGIIIIVAVASNFALKIGMKREVQWGLLVGPDVSWW